MGANRGWLGFQISLEKQLIKGMGAKIQVRSVYFLAFFRISDAAWMLAHLTIGNVLILYKYFIFSKVKL